MALGTRHDFSMHRGDDRQITFQVVDESQAPFDITGAALTWIMAEQDLKEAATATPKPKATTLVTKTVGSGITITAPATGDLQVDLDSADTVTFKAPLAYYHELQLTVGGFVTTVAFGIITIERDIAAPGP